MAASASVALQNRPYRSHRVPACTRCRSRKIRCNIDIPGEPCLSCRERRLKCLYVDPPKTSPPSESNVDGRPTKRQRTNKNGDATDETPPRPHALPTLHRPSTHPSASIMLAPHVAEDVDILQRHISQHKTSEGEDPQSYQTLSHDTRNPIVYLSVPRYRSGLRPEAGPGKEQLEIIEQVIGPFKKEVIDLYFQHTHPHFPILDDETCGAIREGGPAERAPNNLMCCVYANGAFHWRYSDTLKLHPRPNNYYVWNKAISAVLEDFLSPSLATVSSAVLDLIGRPSVSIMNNATLCGRNVALAQTFGLHRDPSKWEMSDEDKSTRIRIWWGVLITDYWSSFAYGAPPHIVKDFYDVPMPTLEFLLASSNSKVNLNQRYATACFIHLCALTELLGDVLSLVHRLRPDPSEFYHSVERRKVELSELEARMPEWLSSPNRPGSSNLWFCFLSVKLLLSRSSLRAAVLLGDTQLEKIRLEDLRVSSSAVLDFVLSLGEAQFHDFWLPYATYLLVMAVMVSLRCTVEAQHVEVRNACFSRLQQVMAHIQHAHDDYDWDIAKYCLERCKDAVAKISSYATRDAQTQQQLQPAQHQLQHQHMLEMDPIQHDGAGGFEEPSFLLSDFFDPAAFDFSWEALWDTPSGMNFTI
ncbi:C6 transcription factor-like protein [Westerdykella ornata]|uniref:C6 transcription factor-like protein n=1 Tax=Westerdykella ornata TaxID=318751 RepID=A0A6A6JBQ4_WESOR|nr:C6 transcription factor-like protein [Westerdykella ornata]KAF2274011.1 C6 transcription factor-like protein [Westerdykella ornata]